MNIRARGAAVGLALAVSLALSGCGTLEKGPPEAAAGTTLIKVGAMPLLNLVPLNLAADPAHHLFADEGLSIAPVAIPNGGAGLVKLLNGEADVSYVSVVTAVQAQAKVADVKDSAKRFTIIAPASANAVLAMALVVKEYGPIKSARDLKGKRIAINQAGGLADAMVRSVLITNQVDPRDARLAYGLRFEDMPNLLASDSVDAALVPEPYVTSSATVAGAVPLVDFQTTGDTQDLPLDCYVTTEKYANEHPAEIAKFQRAMRAGASLATNDRQAVVSEVPKFIPTITADQALAWLHYPAYPQSVNEKVYQRVPDLLARYGLAATAFPIGSMIYKGPVQPSPSSR